MEHDPHWREGREGEDGCVKRKEVGQVRSGK